MATDYCPDPLSSMQACRLASSPSFSARNLEQGDGALMEAFEAVFQGMSDQRQTCRIRHLRDQAQWDTYQIKQPRFQAVWLPGALLRVGPARKKRPQPPAASTVQPGRRPNVYLRRARQCLPGLRELPIVTRYFTGGTGKHPLES